MRSTIAPIIIREKNKWMEISNQLNNRNIQYVKVRNIRTGIEVEPATEDDYRFMIRYLSEINVQYHTYELKSGKPLKVVIKGIPLDNRGRENSRIYAGKQLPSMQGHTDEK